MNGKNICKFIPAKSSISLAVYNFVLESDPEVMRADYELQQHRALLVSSGEGVFFFGSQKISAPKGTLAFGFEGEKFAAEGTDSFQYIYISFSGERSEELFRRFGINVNTRHVSGFEGLVPLWNDSLSRASEENIDLAAESMLLYALSRLRADSKENNDIINKIVFLTEECFTEFSLSVSSVAAELGYNEKYISHLFKERMGVSYSEYLRNLRLKYAVSLLEHGIDSVKNVALLSGFSDPLYFSTVFKKDIGISPKEYMKKNGKR